MDKGMAITHKRHTHTHTSHLVAVELDKCGGEASPVGDVLEQDACSLIEGLVEQPAFKIKQAKETHLVSRL